MRRTLTAAITRATLLAVLACGCEPDTSGVIVHSRSILTLAARADGSLEPAYAVEPGVRGHRHRPRAREPSSASNRPAEPQCSDQTLWHDHVLTVNWHVDRDCSVSNKPLAHAAGRKLRVMVEVIPADADFCPLVTGRDRRPVQNVDGGRARDVRVRDCFQTTFHHLPPGTYEIVRPDRGERFVVR